MPRSMWDLTRGQTHTACIWSWVLTTGPPGNSFQVFILYCRVDVWFKKLCEFQVKQSDLVTYIYIFFLFQILFLCRLLQIIELSSLCYNQQYVLVDYYYILYYIYYIYIKSVNYTTIYLLYYIYMLSVILHCYISVWGFPVAQLVKNLPAMQETRVQSLGRENPLEKGMATHSSFLAWRIPWTEEPCGLQSTGLQRVRHGWVTNTHVYLLYYICMYIYMLSIILHYYICFIYSGVYTFEKIVWHYQLNGHESEQNPRIWW